MYFLNQG